MKVEAVRLFLLNMQDLETELESAESLESRVSIYESILKQCIDAQQALRDALQDDAVSIFTLYPNLFVSEARYHSCTMKEMQMFYGHAYLKMHFLYLIYR